MTLPDIATSISPVEADRLVELARDSVVLEVGSWRGFSTVAMAQVARRVYAVDHHLGDEHAGHDESLSYLIANLDRYGVRDRVAVLVSDAAGILPALGKPLADGAFLDAFHEAPAVRGDLAMVWPLVRTGGWLAIHDYGRFGVAEAVDELVAWYGLDLELTETLAVVRKS